MPISANNKTKIAISLIATGMASMILVPAFGLFSSTANFVYLYIAGVSLVASGVLIGNSIPREHFRYPISAESDTNIPFNRELLGAPPMYSPPPSYENSPNVSLQNLASTQVVPQSIISSQNPPSYAAVINENANNQASQTR